MRTTMVRRYLALTVLFLLLGSSTSRDEQEQRRTCEAARTTPEVVNGVALAPTGCGGGGGDPKRVDVGVLGMFSSGTNMLRCALRRAMATLPGRGVHNSVHPFGKHCPTSCRGFELNRLTAIAVLVRNPVEWVTKKSVFSYSLQCLKGQGRCVWVLSGIAHSAALRCP